MSEQILAAHCSPTLAGIKTGNLFTCCIPEGKTLFSVIHRWNTLLNPKGVFILAFPCRADRAMIYVYRKSRLEKDLFSPETQLFLREFGYGQENNLPAILAKLAERLEKSSGFPHEIGLFLGYPLEDVKGFIANKGRNCKCTGYWKVYGDVGTAQNLFQKYRKCTDIYCRKLREGTSILRLTVTA